MSPGSSHARRTARYEFACGSLRQLRPRSVGNWRRADVCLAERNVVWPLCGLLASLREAVVHNDTLAKPHDELRREVNADFGPPI